MPEEDISTLPPLHPRRVAATMQAVEAHLADPTVHSVESVGMQTALAALKQVARAQAVIGITGDVADLGSGLLQAAGSFSKLLRKRK